MSVVVCSLALVLNHIWTNEMVEGKLLATNGENYLVDFREGVKPLREVDKTVNPDNYKQVMISKENCFFKQ